MKEGTVMKEALDRITSRHIGRLLHRLEQLDTPILVLNAIKREMWLMNEDVYGLTEGKSNDEAENERVD